MQVWAQEEVYKYPCSSREDSMQQEGAAAIPVEEQLGVDELVLQIGDDVDEVQQPTTQVMKTN
jgi:hypothetical protein